MGDDDNEVYLTNDSISEYNSFVSLRSDNELFDEEANVPGEVISARLIKLPKKAGYRWEIVKDDEIALSLNEIKFTKKEKNFLFSAAGMKFLVAAYKNGATSIIKIKNLLKKKKL